MKTKALIKTVLCYAMALAMLFTTALPVSAAGLRGIYNLDSNTEGSGKRTGTGTVTDSEEHPGGGEDSDPTKPTSSHSGVMNVGAEKKVVGVVLNASAVSMVAGDEADLTATIIYEDSSKADVEDDGKYLQWSVTEESSVTGDSVATVKGEKYHATVTALHGGNAKVVVSLTVKDETGEEFTFSDDAEIDVLEYAKEIHFDTIPTQYFKHTLNLNAYLVRDPETSNDAIDFSLVSGVDKDGKAVKATKLASIKNGVVTFKTVEGKLTVQAVSEMGKVATTEIEIKEGNPITKIEIESGKTTELEITAKMQADLVVKYTTKYEGETTDIIDWSSKKTTIATVSGSGVAAKTGTATAVGVGKTTVTAKATSGKKVNFTVKVTAPLQTLSIEDKNGSNEGYAYTGQTVQLTAVKTPAQNTDKVTWKSSNTKIAKVSAKGVVTAAKKLEDDEATVTITATCGKGDAKKEAAYTLTVKRSNIASVTVTPLNPDMFEGRDLQLVAVPKDPEGNVLPVEVLSWKSAKTKIASVSSEGLVNALTKGKAKITVSAYNNKGQLVKADTTVNVKRVVNQLQLNKTAVTVFPKLSKGNPVEQKVSLSVKKQLPSGATAEPITWSVDNSAYTLKTSGKNNVKVAVTVPASAQPGDSVTVTATSKSGATASAVITFCNKTSKVQFQTLEGAEIKPAKLAIGVGDDKKGTAKAVVESDKGFGAAGNETVTYSVNKKGIATVVENEDGSITVIGIKKGTVKITAKTVSGKKAVLTVSVNPNL